MSNTTTDHTMTLLTSTEQTQFPPELDNTSLFPSVENTTFNNYRYELTWTNESITLTAVSAVGVLLCGSSVLAISKTKKEMGAFLLFISSLTVADLGVCLSLVLHYISTRSIYFFSDYLCVDLATTTLLSVMMIASTLSCFGLFIFQFLATFRPLQYASMARRTRAFVVIALLWLVSTLISSLTMAYYFVFEHKNNQPISELCKALAHTLTKTDGRTSKVYGGILAILIPISFGLNLKIFLIARNRASSKLKHRDSSISGKIHHTTLRDTITGLILFSTLLIFWLPYLIVSLLNVDCEWHGCMSEYWLLGPILNSLIDPITYGIRVPKIRRSYSDIFHYLCCHRKQAASSHSDTTYVSTHTRSPSARYGSDSGQESIHTSENETLSFPLKVILTPKP